MKSYAAVELDDNGFVGNETDEATDYETDDALYAEAPRRHYMAEDDSSDESSDDRKSDKNFNLAAYQYSFLGQILESAAMQDGEEWIMDAVRITGEAFSYASERLKNDKDFIVAAVKQDYKAIV